VRNFSKFGGFVRRFFIIGIVNLPSPAPWSPVATFQALNLRI